MRISDVLKEKGLFSKDIKIRFQNGQIRLNNEVIKEDLEITILNIRPNVKFDDIVEEAGNFIYKNIVIDKNWSLQCQIFGFENLFDTNINSDLTNFLNNFVLLRISKKQVFIIKK